MVLDLADRVRIDIPDETDPDHQFHGEHEIIIAIANKSCPCGYGVLYRVALETHDIALDLHPWDLRPPIESELELNDSSLRCEQSF